MKPLTTVACLVGFLCFSSLSAAELRLLDVTNLPDGKYLLVVSGGSLSIQSALVIVPGTPTPPIPPTPDVLTVRGKAIKAAAEAASADPKRTETAAALAVAMGEVKKLIDAKTITSYQQIATAVTFLWDQTVKSPAVWAPCRKLVTDELAKLAQEGKPAGDYGVYLGEVADGLRATAPAMEADINWLELLKTLLDIFVKYILPLLKG